VEWRLGAAAHDGVLTGEGVGGDIGAIWELRGWEREMRATSIEGGGGGTVSPKSVRWAFWCSALFMGAAAVR
jgi:hypothetical protein